MSITRFEARKNLMIREANALSTAYLRAQLFSDRSSIELKALLRSYLRDRIEHVQCDDPTFDLQKQIWRVVHNITLTDRSAVSASLIAALNEVFDLRSEAEFMRFNHVPEAVYWVIIIVAMIGLATQEHGRLAALFLAFLVALVLTLIQDLDRPNRGWIRIDQNVLMQLEATVFRPAN